MLWPKNLRLRYAVRHGASSRVRDLVVAGANVEATNSQGLSVLMLAAEHVIFHMSLRGLGKKRRQRLIRLTDVKTIVSMRNFDKHHDGHFLRLRPTAMCSVSWPSLGATRLAVAPELRSSVSVRPTM